jgi:hypothetical protein
MLDLQRLAERILSIPRKKPQHPCVFCGAEVDNVDYTLCRECFDAGQRAGSAPVDPHRWHQRGCPWFAIDRQGKHGECMCEGPGDE